ncbi:MAG: ABC transporter permease, partial [Clostridia bacterium]|nr:ABC transporter permease [Clostridia bacterium]
VIALVLWMGLQPTDLKLMTALLVVLALASPQLKQRLRLGASGS